MDWWDDLWLN
jgi:hypothetical protein